MLGFHKLMRYEYFSNDNENKDTLSDDEIPKDAFLFLSCLCIFVVPEMVTRTNQRKDIEMIA